MADQELATALRAVLDQDSFPAVGRLLRADPRLLGEAADRKLDVLAERADPDTDPLGPERIAAWRGFLRRCTPATLEAVVPAGATVIDPQVVALVMDDLRAADEAEAAYDRDSLVEHLDRAVHHRDAILERILGASPFPGLRAALLNDAAGARLRRYWARDQDRDLDAAGTLFAGAVDLTPPRSPARPGRLGNLAVVFRETALRRGDDEALTAAESVAREAVELLPATPAAGSPASEILTNLALVLRDRYRRTNDVELVDEAVTHAERAVTLSPAISPSVMLAGLLGDRFPHSGEVDDLRRAVELLDGAAAATPPGNPERPRRLVDLAIALTESHAVLGERDELDRAVECCLEAVRHPALAASPDLPAARVQLAMARYRRFEVSGTLDDLEAAIAELDDVVAFASGSEADVRGWRVNLSTALVQRGRRLEDTADLDRAIEQYAEVAQDPGMEVDRYAVLNNLGNAYRDRARTSRLVPDLDAAIDSLTEALSCTRPGSARRATTLANLGIALRERGRLTGAVVDLDGGVECTREALEIGAPGDVDRVRRLFAHAETCRARAEARSGPQAHADRARADETYREGCRLGLLVDPESTMLAAVDMGAVATEERAWSVAAETLGTALEAFRSLTTAQIGRRHEETWLRAGRALPARAAYALVEDGRAAEAVVALEGGRATLLSEALGRGRLRSVDPELRERYERASSLLSGAHRPGRLEGRP